MENTIEVELKFELLDQVKLASFLNTLSLQGEAGGTDVYLDTPDFALFKRGIFVRVRDDASLDFKFNEDRLNNENKNHEHTHCEETSFNLPLLMENSESINKVLRLLSLNTVTEISLEAIKSANGWIDALIISKVRKTYKAGEYKIMFDEVSDLGSFIEIEKMASKDDNLVKVKEDMYAFLKDFDPKYVDVGYVELYLRKYNRAVYLQGKYLMDEDRPLTQ